MKAKLEKIKNEATGTKSFLFSTENKFKFLPGQFIYLTLPGLKDDYRGPTRYFTISSSPTEGRLIVITTRIRKISKFKLALAKLKKGKLVEIEGPSGTFILDEHESDNDHILIAGGIGITPFRSFIKYNIDKKLKSNIHLIYSNRKVSEITFRKEIEDWSKRHKNIKLTMTITEANSKTPSSYIRDRINKKLLNNLISQSLNNLTFWISGPPTFVDAMEKIMVDTKISSKKIHTDKFSGY